jgi:hypothetical protein
MRLARRRERAYLGRRDATPSYPLRHQQNAKRRSVVHGQDRHRASKDYTTVNEFTDEARDSQSLSPCVSEDLPPGFLQRYKDAFVPAFSQPFGQQWPSEQKSRRWYTESRQGHWLTDTKLQRHFSGENTVGLVVRASTLWCCLDIDKGKAWRSLYKRADAARSAFSVDPLTFSTPRGGLHLWYLLEGRGWTNRAVDYAKSRLDAAGVDLKPGLVELYPAGRHLLRAPLGRDSFLLNDNYDPVSLDRPQNLWTLDQILRDDKVEPLTIPEDYQATRTPEEQQQRGQRRHTAGSTSEFMLTIDRLLSTGLRAKESAEGILKMRWYYLEVCKFDQDQTVQAVWSWFREHHNGNSASYTKNPNSTLKMIERAVQSFDREKINTRSEALKRSQKASPAQKADIQAFIAQKAIPEPLSAFYASLLDYAQRRGEERAGWMAVEIPSRTLQTFNREYAPYMRDLERLDLVRRGRNYGAQIGRCQEYLLPYLEKAV